MTLLILGRGGGKSITSGAIDELFIVFLTQLVFTYKFLFFISIHIAFEGALQIKVSSIRHKKKLTKIDCPHSVLYESMITL